MQQPDNSKYVPYLKIVALALLLAPLGACAEYPKQPPTPIDLSLKISPKGQVMILDEKGNPAKTVPISERPIPATEIQSIETINIIRVHENPCYVYVCSAGRCSWRKVSDDNCAR